MTAATSSQRVLVADIGGTNVRFAVVSPRGKGPEVLRSFRCQAFPGLAEAAEAYIEDLDGPTPEAAIIAVAAPVTGERVRLTNNDWLIDTQALQRQLGLDHIRLVNDFVAQAMALPALRQEDLDTLQPGRPDPQGPRAVIGPGTGLGVASLLPCNGGWLPIQGEGGHVTFSPVTDREMAVAARVRARFGHCSAERLISGPGLLLLYEMLAGLDGAGNPPPPEPARVVEQAAAGNDPLAREAVELFVAGLATTAGNLALTLGATGGVYLCGGILPRLGGTFRADDFLARFLDKGRFREYLRAVPVHLVTAREPALIGLSRLAADNPPGPTTP